MKSHKCHVLKNYHVYSIAYDYGVVFNDEWILCTALVCYTLKDIKDVKEVAMAVETAIASKQVNWVLLWDVNCYMW